MLARLSPVYAGSSAFLCVSFCVHNVQGNRESRSLMTSGWRIGSIFGIPLLLNPTWFYSLALFAFFFSMDWQRAGWDLGWAWIGGLVMALLLFASVLLHELGHSLVAQSQGIPVNTITLFPLGGIASIAQESETPGQAFWVAIAGPAVSFALFVLLLLLSLALPEAVPLKLMFSRLAVINLVLALFNMMPGLPLDGGQVVKAAIWKITGSRIKGVRQAAQIGQLLSWAAILTGLIGFLMPLWTAFLIGITGFLSPPNFNFLWLVLLGWFGIRRANAYCRVIALQETMLQLRAADAMRQEFQTVEADLTLEQFATTYLITDPTATLITDPAATADPVLEVYYAASHGQYLGLIGLEKLRAIERSQWGVETVRTLVNPLEQLPTVAESTCLAQVIEQLESHQIPQLPVVSAASIVTGVIDRADVVQALANKLHLLVPDAVIQQIRQTGQFPPNLQLQGIAKDALK